MKKFNYIFLTMLLMFMFAVPSFADVINEGPVGNQNNTSAEVNGVTAGVDSHDTITNKAAVIPGNVQYGGMPGYFGDNNKPGHQFISLDKLMMYNTAWNIKDNAANSCGINFNYTPHTEKVAKEDRSKVVICTKNIFDKNLYKVELLGVGTMNSTQKKVISSDLLDNVLKEASYYGATHIQFLGEGTNTELQSSGWGIGLSYTKASDTSVSTGGTGFSTGWAGYHNLPWQQFFFLKVVDPAAVAVIEAEKAEKAAAVEADTIVDANVDKAVKKATTE